MDNAKDKAYKKIEQNLFKPQSEAAKDLTPLQLERRNRWIYCISQKMENPMISDRLLVENLMQGIEGMFKAVPISTAYRDLGTVTKLTGNIQSASKAWIRYMLVEGAKKGFSIAEKDDDAKGMAANLTVIMKTTRADQDDDDMAEILENMIPPSFEPTDDPSTLGESFQDIDMAALEEKRKNLRALFAKGEYINYEDVKDADTK